MPLIIACLVVVFSVIIFGLLAYHPSMRLLVLPLLCLGLCQCSSQVITTANGVRMMNNNLASKGALIQQNDGTIIMSGDSEKAGEHFAKYLRLMGMIDIAGIGVEAMKDIGTEALNK